MTAPGINGKVNEFRAALGLLQLTKIDHAIGLRKQIDARYREGLAAVRGIEMLAPPAGIEYNYGYFPILVTPEYAIGRDELYERLRTQDVLARRYFYPLISEFPMYRGFASADPANLPIATRVSRQILCLPIYPDWPFEEIDWVIDLIARS